MKTKFLSNLASALKMSSRISLHSTRTPAIVANSTNPPILMVHGALASESTYRTIMKRTDFAPSRDKIGVDLRNHGQSPHLDVSAGMSYQEMALDLINFLDDIEVEKACVIGHSMGGKVAMQLALTYPSRVSELVVVDISPVNYKIGKDSGDPYIATKAMRSVDLPSCQTRQDVDDQLLHYGVESQSVRQFVMTNLIPVRNHISKYQWKVNLEAVEAAFPSIMAFPDNTGKCYTGPTCVIRGGKSKYVPFQTMKVFTSLFPNTKLITISEAGHWLQAQAPDDFCKSVNDFLGE